MMAVIFRGYTVWVMNVVLCIYFFTQTFKITDYNRIKVNSFNIHQSHQIAQENSVFLHRKPSQIHRLCRLMER